jgi:hypothetical protein
MKTPVEKMAEASAAPRVPPLLNAGRTSGSANNLKAPMPGTSTGGAISSSPPADQTRPVGSPSPVR